MTVTGSMVAVERTFFLIKSRARAVLCQYTLVSFTMIDRGSDRNSFTLRVGVFRLNLMGNRYTRENFTDIYAKRDNSSVTQNCTSMKLSDPLPVLEGDRLAVHIRNGCRNGSCPLQPNLNISAQTLVFFRRGFDPEWIAVKRVTATENYTNVYLDVSASIGKLIVFLWQYT